jgi:hypothetical protein
VKTAHAAEMPARGVNPPLTGNECTMDFVFEMGMEVAWGEERCVVSGSIVCPLVFPQADSLAPCATLQARRGAFAWVR